MALSDEVRAIIREAREAVYESLAGQTTILDAHALGVLDALLITNAAGIGGNPQNTCLMFDDVDPIEADDGADEAEELARLRKTIEADGEIIRGLRRELRKRRKQNAKRDDSGAAGTGPDA